MGKSLICPKCEKESIYNTSPDISSYSFRCTYCNNMFTTKIVKIRAKRSRGDKPKNKRTFSIRAYKLSGEEDFIEFETGSYDDFELRSKDIVAFSSYEGELKIVQNLNIKRYMVVSEPGCYLATHVYGASSHEVSLLRQFRDDCLLDSAIFKYLVATYYVISPRMVSLFGRFTLFSAFIRFALAPVIMLIAMRYRVKHN